MLSAVSGSLNFNIRISVSYFGSRRSDCPTQICCFKTPDGEKIRCRGKNARMENRMPTVVMNFNKTREKKEGKKSAFKGNQSS